MRLRLFILLLTLILWRPASTSAWDSFEELLATRASETPIQQNNGFSLKTNFVPWAATIANIGIEGAFAKHWSADLELWYCPWKLSEKLSLKTFAILPEFRWWPNSNLKGSFISLHFTVGWYYFRLDSNRYQDVDRPLLGAGIGYGYLLELNKNWGLEFTVGAGYINTRYNRFYNVENGALADTRVTSYWGIDRLGISLVCHL